MMVLCQRQVCDGNEVTVMATTTVENFAIRMKKVHLQRHSDWTSIFDADICLTFFCSIWGTFGILLLQKNQGRMSLRMRLILYNGTILFDLLGYTMNRNTGVMQSCIVNNIPSSPENFPLSEKHEACSQLHSTASPTFITLKALLWSPAPQYFNAWANLPNNQSYNCNCREHQVIAKTPWY